MRIELPAAFNGINSALLLDGSLAAATINLHILV